LTFQLTPNDQTKMFGNILSRLSTDISRFTAKSPATVPYVAPKLVMYETSAPAICPEVTISE
jgi:hypothetical protein